MEEGLPGKILDWAEARGVKPNLNLQRNHTEMPRESVRLLPYSVKAWVLSGSALSQLHSAADVIFTIQIVSVHLCCGSNRAKGEQNIPPNLARQYQTLTRTSKPQLLDL